MFEDFGGEIWRFLKIFGGEVWRFLRILVEKLGNF
jgi:hypothetical protein